MLKTVKVPEPFIPLFETAEKYVDAFFRTLDKSPEKGTIRIGGDRYILIRCDSISHSYVDQVKETIGQEAAYEFLYNFTRILGQKDASAFVKKMKVDSPPEKLSAGPVHFAYAGWALVDIHPASQPSPDENYYLEYTHPNTFEAETYLKMKKDKAEKPVCIFSAGYSAGWCTESFGVEVHGREVTCMARGDQACQFIMAPRDRLDEYEEKFFLSRGLPFEKKKNLVSQYEESQAKIDYFAANLVEQQLPEEGSFSLENLAAKIHEGLTLFAGPERATIARTRILQLGWISNPQTLKEHLISIVDSQVKNAVIEQERVNKELEIATQIQTAILPKIPQHPELEIAAYMRPATEVSGDYYDILWDKNQRLWFGIGDVSGHGVTTGLAMMMAQSSFSTCISRGELVTPKEALVAVNELLYKNLRNRIGSEDYMTLTLLLYQGEGKFTYAGKHLDLVVYRKEKEACERLTTEGLFAGILPDIADVTTDKNFVLHPEDVLVLYTDGIIEAKNGKGELFDLERLLQLVENHAHQSSEAIKDVILSEALEWCDNNPRDDLSMVIIKRK